MLLLRSIYIIWEQKELLLKTLVGINALLHIWWFGKVCPAQYAEFLGILIIFWISFWKLFLHLKVKFKWVISLDNLCLNVELTKKIDLLEIYVNIPHKIIFSTNLNKSYKTLFSQPSVKKKR